MSKTDTALASSLFSMNKVSSGGSLVFLPDFGGNVLYARPLVSDLTDDLSCFGVRLAPDMIDHLDDLTLTNMARRFAEDIAQSNLPQPLHIWGFSFAGIVAFETARALSEISNHSVNLWILDTRVPQKSIAKRLVQKPLRELIYAAQYAKENWRRLMGRNTDPMILHHYGLIRFDLSQHAEAYRFVIRHLYDAMIRYTPRHWHGSATIIQARDARWSRPSDDLGWTPFIGGNLEVLPVPGDHLTMLRNPEYAAEVASHIRSRL